MNVFVLNKHGEALMPCKPRKAKILLREGKAKVVKGYCQEIPAGLPRG
jgi:hypothetical protein